MVPWWVVLDLIIALLLVLDTVVAFIVASTLLFIDVPFLWGCAAAFFPLVVLEALVIYVNVFVGRHDRRVDTIVLL